MLESIKNRIIQNPGLKKFVSGLMIPKNQFRARWWVRVLWNPFIHHRGKRSIIRRRTRMDLMPFHQFSLGNDSMIEDFATVNNAVGDVLIGDRSLIGIGDVLIGPLKIGNDVLLAQNVVVSALNHHYENIKIPISQQNYSTQAIVIADGAWIGANSVIVAGVSVGKNAVIAGGSVVTKDVPDFTVVAGNPARIMKQYNPNREKWEKSTQPMINE
jgi:acetyltransferase-like isoleucine patch superfamily enzyme